jgi:hypothetical protein
MDNKQLNIELTDEIAGGIYSNLAVISHSGSEFVVDFIQMMPNMPQARVRSRIVMTPQNTKRLMRALADNIQRYEAQFGRINDDQPNFPPTNFSGGPTQA